MVAFGIFVALVYMPLRIILSSSVARKCNDYMFPQCGGTSSNIIHEAIVLRIFQILNISNDEFRRLDKIPTYLNWMLFIVLYCEVGFLISVIIFAKFSLG